MPIAPEYLHLAYTGPMTAILYGRASRDPKKRGRSVNDQLYESRELCETHGWPIVDTFRDIDRSASRHAKKTRDDFEAMVEAINAGKCRIVVAWEASRYYRDLEIYIRLRNVCAQNNVLLCYNGTVYDLSKRADRKATAQDALQAEDEAEGIRDRVLRTVRLNAERGKPHGRILYGYTRRYDPDTGDLIDQVPHPEHAPIVRDIFKMRAEGKAGNFIAKHLNERGIKTLHGHAWTPIAVSNLLRNPGYIGRRIHQGQEIGDATWDPLIDSTTWNTVQALLADSRWKGERPTSVRHLLTGIALCGTCETPLRLTKNRNRYFAYSCPGQYCVAIQEQLLDAYVEEWLLARLARPDAAEVFLPPDTGDAVTAAVAEQEKLEARLQEARDAAGDGTLSIKSLAALEAKLLPQIEAAKARARESVRNPLLHDLVTADDHEQAWDRLVLEQRRTVIRDMVTIRVHKGRRGVGRITPGRVTIDPPQG
jgi:DNA invertase Pin-like site-specific DNA recombinase